MSYLAEPTSKLNYGIVQIGNFIEVDDAGIISLQQDVSPTADVAFNSVDAGDITVGGSNVVTSVTPTGGYGIDITNLQSSGYDGWYSLPGFQRNVFLHPEKPPPPHSIHNQVLFSMKSARR